MSYWFYEWKILYPNNSDIIVQVYNILKDLNIFDEYSKHTLISDDVRCVAFKTDALTRVSANELLELIVNVIKSYTGSFYDITAYKYYEADDDEHLFAESDPIAESNN